MRNEPVMTRPSITFRSLRYPLLAIASACALLASAAPAGAVAPQPVDASDQGALAFVCFAIMCGLIAASLFYMDRVRKRRTGEED
jgi:hypothetical protein